MPLFCSANAKTSYLMIYNSFLAITNMLSQKFQILKFTEKAGYLYSEIVDTVTDLLAFFKVIFKISNNKEFTYKILIKFFVILYPLKLLHKTSWNRNNRNSSSAMY